MKEVSVSVRPIVQVTIYGRRSKKLISDFLTFIDYHNIFETRRGICAPLHYSGFFKPQDAKKIENWLNQHKGNK